MKKRNWKKITAFALSLSLLISVFSTLVWQSGATDLPESGELAEPAAIIAEETSLREECVKHFRLDNGSFMALTYASPVHYKENGQWKDTDNRLVLSDSVRSASN